jgi:regulator of replication initiation timing
MLKSIWTKIVGAKVYLILGLILLSAVGGLYTYINHLENKVTNLTKDNIVLKDDNQELGKNLEEVNRRQEVTSEITNHYDVVRKENRVNRDRKNENIQKQVNSGQDKPVGSLLKDFLNAE